jgi:hypothetical protein
LDNVWSMILIHKFEEIYENHEPPPMQDAWDPTKLQEQLIRQLPLFYEQRNEHPSCICDVRTDCANIGKWQHINNVYDYES